MTCSLAWRQDSQSSNLEINEDDTKTWDNGIGIVMIDKATIAVFKK